MPNQSPFITVILPVYNVEKYLDDCLGSLLKQTYKHFEVIAVNDGSTDNSLEVLSRYQNQFDQMKIINQENRGLSGARNTGLNYVSGKYTYFLDSDDLLLANTFENLVNQAEQHNADLIRFCAESFVEDDFDYDYNSNLYRDQKELVPNQVYDRDSFIQINWKKKVYRSPVWLYFFRSEILLKNQLDFEERLIHEDELFTPIALLHCERILYDPTPYFQRRYRPNSIMTSGIYSNLNSYKSKRIILQKLGSYRKSLRLSETGQRFLDWRINYTYKTILRYQFADFNALAKEVKEVTKFKQFVFYSKFKGRRLLKTIKSTK